MYILAINYISIVGSLITSNLSYHIETNININCMIILLIVINSTIDYIN